MTELDEKPRTNRSGYPSAPSESRERGRQQPEPAHHGAGDRRAAPPRLQAPRIRGPGPRERVVAPLSPARSAKSATAIAQIRGRNSVDLRIVCAFGPVPAFEPGIGRPSWTDEGSDQMRIEQLMTKSPKTCRPDSSLSHAARLMWENDFGCLPVTEGDESGRLVGMITDRDICMAAYFAGRALNEIQVADAMTKDVRACNPGDDARRSQVHHAGDGGAQASRDR